MPALTWSTITAHYFHLVNTIVPGPQSWTFFIPHILLPASLLVSPHVLSHNALASLVFPVILGSTIHAVISMRGPDVISMDTLWWCFYFLVLKDPRKDFKRVVEKKGDSPAKSAGVKQGGNETLSKPKTVSNLEDWPYPSTFLSRLKWVFILISERPLTSWKTGRTSHDSNIPPLYIQRTRTRFVRDIMLILLPAVLIFMPLALRLHTLDSLIQPLERAGGPKSSIDDVLSYVQSHRFSVLRILHRFLPARLLRSLSVGMFLYSFLILHFLGVYLIPPFLSFLANPASGATHTWSTHLWPRPHFGPFSAVLDSGLRGLWGTWWHQQMRHAVSEPGRCLSDRIGLGRGIVRYGVICASAFLLSGITHMGLVPPDATDAWNLRLMIGAFFFAQPLGILMEVAVVEKILKRVEALVGETKLQRTIIRATRLCWVLLFMSFPLGFLERPFEQLGYWKIWPWYFLGGGVKSLLRGDWIP